MTIKQIKNEKDNQETLAVKKDSKILNQNWAGGLKEFNKKYFSIELQKLSLEWRKKVT